LAGTLLLCLTGADVALSRQFYGGLDTNWPFLNAQPWRGIYDFGVYPGLALGIGGLIVALAAPFFQKLRPWGKAGCFLALALSLGPGLIVNGVLKPQWGRPRPSQVAAFGGDREYLPVWVRGPDTNGKSFPCGHASIGFFLMLPAFLVYRRRPRLARAFFGLGLAYGGVLGLTRVVQGRHFPSDVLWSAACVYFCGLALYVLLRLEPDGAGASVEAEPAFDALSFPEPIPEERDRRKAA